MPQAVIDMRVGFGIHQMAPIGQIVQIHNHQGTGIEPISRRAPIYRKYAKRREKLETTKHRGTSIQVHTIRMGS